MVTGNFHHQETKENYNEYERAAAILNRVVPFALNNLRGGQYPVIIFMSNGNGKNVAYTPFCVNNFNYNYIINYRSRKLNSN